jgi:hypothetical protein
VRVRFEGLVAGTTYYYVCGSEGTRSPWSQVYSFVYMQGAARAGGAPVYAVLADFGYYNAESLERLTAEAFEGTFDTLLHAGDFAYDFDADAGRVGDGYMRQLAPVISSMPYMGIPGNHESASNYTHYKMRFASVAENAGANSGSSTNMFYSFNDGLAHFVMWDSEAYVFLASHLRMRSISRRQACSLSMRLQVPRTHFPLSPTLCFQVLVAAARLAGLHGELAPRGPRGRQRGPRRGVGGRRGGCDAGGRGCVRRAHAARRELAHGARRRGEEAIQSLVHGKGYSGPYGYPRIEVQLKCYQNFPIKSPGFSYPLKIKNYNDLRVTHVLVPRILIWLFPRI